MPVPMLTDPPSTTSSSTTPAKPPGQPSQKSMTKAERRELQEKQRAAKAALKTQQQPQQGGSSSGGAAQPKAPKTPATPQKKPQTGEASKQGAPIGKDAATTMGDTTGGKDVSRSLRIFSHFGLPKQVSQTKGDIHPAIVRLGLLFSEFKICGANARCIATLTAFKSVRFLFVFLLFDSRVPSRLSKIIPPLLIIPSRVT